jgi:hypothetical protein
MVASIPQINTRNCLWFCAHREWWWSRKSI